MKHYLKSAVAAVALIVAAGSSFAADYNIMAPAAPCGGWDQTARTIHTVLLKYGRH